MTRNFHVAFADTSSMDELVGKDSATTSLLGDIRSLIEAARGRVAAAVNTELVMLNWRIGHRIRQDILGQERAGYGERAVEALGRKLTEEYGRGFSRPNLIHMIMMPFRSE